MASRSRYSWGFVLCALFAAAGCAQRATQRPPVTGGPGVQGLAVHVEERFYAVSGHTATSLNRALVHEGPSVRGRKAHGLTEWRLTWSYVPRQLGQGCSSSRPRVDVRIVTTLPRWLELERAPENLARDWWLFFDRLRHHESEHQDIAMKSGRALLSVLQGLEADDCDRLQEVAERAAAGLASRHEELHVRFDGSADYGVKSLR